MQQVVKAAFLCDHVLTGADGKLSLIGIFGEMNFASLPAAYPRFFVVLILTLDAGRHGVRLGVTDPGGQQMLAEHPTAEVDVELTGTDTNLFVDFNNLGFQRAGIHQMQLFLDGVLVHSIPFNVQAVGQPAGPALA